MREPLSRTLNIVASSLWKISTRTITGSVSKTDHSTLSSQTVSPALVDLHGRTHTYLRISLTERCNLRCFYCMPAEGVQLTVADRLLTADEMVRLVGVFAAAGVEKIRLTGGEPTVRRDLVEIVDKLSQLPGIRAVGMTSNGIALPARKLEALVKAGLTHLNLSLDTLDEMRYAILTRRESGFVHVMRAIECAERTLPTQLKLNCVVIRGVNEDEVVDFVAMTENRNIDVRFIEYMPFGGNAFEARKLVPYREMLAAICQRFTETLPTRLADSANSTSKVGLSSVWLSRQVRLYHVDVGAFLRYVQSTSADCRRQFEGVPSRRSRDFFAGLFTCRRHRRPTVGNDRCGVAQKTRPTRRRGEPREDDQPTDDPHRRLRRRTVSSSAILYQTSSSFTTSISILFANQTLRHYSAITMALRAVHTSAAARLNALSHMDAQGAARMVDVTTKPATKRVATAAAVVEFAPTIFRQIFRANGGSPKGDILGVARLAGIQAAKRTADLIPLCHQIPLSHTDVRFRVDEENYQIRISTRVKCYHGTGIEMEALTASAVAALTVYDMCKALGGASIRVADLRLTGKSGGRSPPTGECAGQIWPPDGFI